MINATEKNTVGEDRKYQQQGWGEDLQFRIRWLNSGTAHCGGDLWANLEKAQGKGLGWEMPSGSEDQPRGRWTRER